MSYNIDDLASHILIYDFILTATDSVTLKMNS